MSTVTSNEFIDIDWLHAMGDPLDDDSAHLLGTFDELEKMLNDDPDAFYESVYESPFEDLCLKDENAAKKVEESLIEQSRTLAEVIYKEAWEICPDPEFCGIVSDDISRIYALILNGNELASFTTDRIAWYTKGRIPWGYSGDYPNGRWIVL